MHRRHLLRTLAVLPALASGLKAWAGGAADREETGSLHMTAAGRLPEPAQVRTVVAAGPPASVLVYCLAPQTLAGWPFQLAPPAQALLRQAGSDRPYLGRLAGRGNTLSLERLLALRPDLVLDIGDVNPFYESAARAVQEQTGIPYVLMGGRLQDSPAQLEQAGLLLGQAARGRRLAEQARMALDRARQAASGRAGGLKAYLARGRDGLETGLGQSIHTEVLRLCGLTVMGDARQDNRLGRISHEQLLAWEPDMLFAQDEAFFQLARSQAPWNRLKAVREGRLYRVPAWPFGWLDGPPGINRLSGLIWLSALLDGPAAVPGMIRDLRAFHASFYGMALTQAQMERLLQGQDPAQEGA
ncbi:MAG: ABC transporter substrate-binding protein [Alcaligenes sp.]